MKKSIERISPRRFRMVYSFSLRGVSFSSPSLRGRGRTWDVVLGPFKATSSQVRTTLALVITLILGAAQRIRESSSCGAR